MRKEIIVPAVALAGGAAGFALRRWELATAFEPMEGGFRLAIPGAVSSLVLAGLSAAMAIVLLLLCRGKHSAFPGGYDQAFSAEGSVPYVSAKVLSGFLALAAAALNLLDLPAAYQAAVVLSRVNHRNPILAVLPRGILALLCVGTCFAAVAAGQNSYRARGRGKRGGALLMPAYMGCAWLTSAYYPRASDPVVLDYVYELFAVVAVLLAFYFIAGFSFARGRSFCAALFSALGIYFSLVTLADEHPLYITLLYGFAIVSLLADLCVLLFNDVRFRDARPEVPAAAEAEGEAPEDEKWLDRELLDRTIWPEGTAEDREHDEKTEESSDE